MGLINKIQIFHNTHIARWCYLLVNVFHDVFQIKNSSTRRVVVVCNPKPVVVDDEGDGLKQHCVLGVGVLHFLGLGRLLGLVQDGLQALRQASSQSTVLYTTHNTVL